MAIKARVHIETAGRSYKPGEVIREQLAESDMTFFRRHGFIVDDSDLELTNAGAGAFDGGETAGAIPGLANLQEDMEEDMEEEEGFKDESALQKMNKKEIVEYAGKIGLELDPKMLQTDLIAAVLNYTEQLTAEAEKED